MPKEKTSILFSNYVIDGVPQELTPAQMLEDCASTPVEIPAGSAFDAIVDETVDPVFTNYRFEGSRVQEYLMAVMAAEKRVPLPFADAYTRSRIATALLDTLWRSGHFKIGDIELKAVWEWNTAAVGSSAAFYSSVHAAADYLDSLDLRLRSFSVKETRHDSQLCLNPSLSALGGQDDFIEYPNRSYRPRMAADSACDSQIDPDPQSWLVYIPFETADYRLGGSLLAQTLGLGGGVATQIQDADYFLDCYEVVRELVEDGIVVAGATVGEGGLLPAVKRMTGGRVGVQMDVSDVMRAYQEDQLVRVLFAEVPGVVVQIRDIDFDYLDAELLLQDVAFFPLGHPVTGGTNSVRVKASSKTGIQTILESLIRNQGGEGED